MATGLEGLAYPQVVSPPNLYTKDPYEVMDYTIDWSADWPGNLPADDPITESLWIPDEGITVVRDSFTDTTTTVWLADGREGWLFHLVNQVGTVGGRRSERTLRFKIKRY